MKRFEINLGKMQVRFILTVFLWFIASNVCLVHSASALNNSSQTSSTQHSCCPEEHEKKAPSSNCDGTLCAQASVSPAAFDALQTPTLYFVDAFLPLLLSLYADTDKIAISPLYIDSSGPPGDRLITLLVLAPNAPPALTSQFV